MGEREIRVSRELTKKYEEHIGNNICQVIDFFKDKEVVGEFTIVINGITNLKKNSEVNIFEIKKDLDDLIRAGLSLSAASKYLAKKNNLLKNIIYNLY